MLEAVSPIDGRYEQKTKDLSSFFSEAALIKYRVLVEIKYFIALSKLDDKRLPKLNDEQIEALHKLYKKFSIEDAQAIKDIEKITNHDVKAVEYFIKENIADIIPEQYLEFVHFALTSQDINNTVFPMMIKDGVEQVYIKTLDEILGVLKQLATEWSSISLLARTHGQAASPTRLGKEIEVFIERLERQTDQLRVQEYFGKFGGATGNFNAHVVAFSEIDWKQFADQFLRDELGLSRLQKTTQIAHYDNLSALFHNLIRIHTILLDLCKDFWTYISIDYFKQKIVANEVGSSAMPHKVNPIDFENAEGNFGVANAILNHLASKLPISRLQRDLTDSTVLRNVGVPIGHALIAFKSVLKGLSKVELNPIKIADDLDNNWAVVSEAIQNILRREGYPKPYEALKALTRGKEKIDQESMHLFIDGLTLTDELKVELKAITPFNYIGV